MSPQLAAIFGQPGDGSSGTGQFPNNFYSAKQFWGASQNTIPTTGVNPAGHGQGNMKLTTKNLVIVGVVVVALIVLWHWNYNR
jgi:hypothetical protein